MYILVHTHVFRYTFIVVYPKIVYSLNTFVYNLLILLLFRKPSPYFFCIGVDTPHVVIAE